MSYITSHALLLKRFDFSETSQIIRMYSRKQGKVSAIAKGARREKSDFNGPFDLFTFGKFTWISRPPNRLNILTESKRKKPFIHLRKHLPTYYTASWIVTFLDRLTAPNDPFTSLFKLSCRILRQLQNHTKLRQKLITFDARGLHMLGHLPRMDQCNTCNTVLDPGSSARFHLALGGTICKQCIQNKNIKRHETTLRQFQLLRPSLGTLKALQKVATSSTTTSNPLEIHRTQEQEMFRILTHCLACIMDELPAFRLKLPSRFFS